MAGLGIEPTLPEYVPGALLTELPSLGESMWIASLCHFNFVNRFIMQPPGLCEVQYITKVLHGHLYLHHSLRHANHVRV